MFEVVKAVAGCVGPDDDGLTVQGNADIAAEPVVQDQAIVPANPDLTIRLPIDLERGPLVGNGVPFLGLPLLELLLGFEAPAETGALELVGA